MSTNTYDFNALLQDAKAGGAWPKGEYDVEITEAVAKVASTGNPMITVNMRCISGEKVGKSINKHNFVLTTDNPNALAMFFRNMAALGLDASFFTQIGQGTLDPVAGALVGRRARIALDHREWPSGSGSMQNSITSFKQLAGGPAGAPGPTAGVPTPGPAMPGTPTAGVPTPGVPAGFPPVPSPASAPAPPAPPQVPSPSPVQPSAPQPSTTATPPPVPGVPAVPAVPAAAPAAPAPAPAAPAPAPAPQAEVPTSASAADNGAAATPPGMTPEAYQQFLQWQAQQAAQAQGGQTPPPLPV